jgi:hypothetical protein
MKKLWILLFLSFTLISCAQIENTVNPTPAKFVAKTEKFGNFTFVVPANFKLKDDASIIYKRGNDVRAYLVYAGTGSIQKIVNFFDENMSQLGWNKSSELIGPAAVLVYKRNNQVIVMKIEKGITGTYLKLLLTCE